MQTIKIAFCDLAADWDLQDNYFTRALEGLPVTYVHGPEASPDYVICGTFGHEALGYACPRIQFSGEDSWPDMNLYDYAMGFPRFTFGDRYLRLPLYAMRESWIPALQKHLQPDEYFTREKFCAFVVSNDCSAERNAFFAALNAHRRVDSGGQYLNNIGEPVQDKIAFQREYRFALAYENSSTPGYTTEKIVDAWASGCVPVYWGAPDIPEEFNPEAFLWAGNYPDRQALIAAIDRLDADREAYLKMCHAPILRPGCRAETYETLAACRAFFEGIFANGTALRRNTSYWGTIYENDLKYYYSLAEKAAHPKTMLQRILGR